MKVRIIQLGFILLSSVFLNGEVNRGPSLNPSGLLIPSGSIGLSQSDFDTGPYRITNPGYYYFEEDVSFDPISPAGGSNGVDGGRLNDRPRTGAWFAAISVECDNVVIDLNAKTFECTEAFVNNHEFKVFAMIELNNSPFPHLVFAYSGETELKTANNVVIKNGTLGRNSHHGIHGNNNTNIRIHDLVIKDWEVAGISFNGLRGGEIKNVTVSGIEHEIQFSGLFALINSALVQLQLLVDAGGQIGTDAQVYLDNLQAYKDTISLEHHPKGSHDGNCYGIFLNRVVDVGPLPLEHCTDGTLNCVTIENVEIRNIKAELIETVGMIEESTGKLLKGLPFGVMRWVDAFDDQEAFAPNAILKAQAYVVKHSVNPFPDHQPTQAFLDNILSQTPSEGIFLSQVKPSFLTDFAGHTNKGVFGLRVDCGHGIEIKNCRIGTIENTGEKGALLADIPAGNEYSELEQIRYTGNDVHGLSLVSCHNCSVRDAWVFECSSSNGYIFGVNLDSHAGVNYFEKCVSSDHRAQLDSTELVVNPSSQVYGYFIEDGSHDQIFVDCASCYLTSPRAACGFFIKEAVRILCERCVSTGHQATSSNNLDQGKFALGFKSIASHCSRFVECRSIGTKCSSETEYSEQSASVAAGFICEENEALDNNTSITNCYSRCHNGGAGIGAGIILNGVYHADVQENTVIANTSEIEAGKGYGIIDNAENTSSIILKNIAYGNKTCNYSVNFEEADQQLPLSSALYGNVSNLHMTNSWNNITLDREPGKEYQEGDRSTTVLIRQRITN